MVPGTNRSTSAASSNQGEGGGTALSLSRGLPGTGRELCWDNFLPESITTAALQEDIRGGMAAAVPPPGWVPTGQP